jgi:hypothetical protein
MTDIGSADLFPIVSREHGENVFRHALGIYVGRGRRYSVAELAKGTGVPQRVIECFKSYAYGHPDYRPLHFGAVLSITLFLGSDFTNEWLRLAGQGAFDLPDDLPSPGDLAADTSEDSAKVVRAAIDGTFDASERRDLPAVGARMMRRGAQIVAIGGRAA